MGLLCSILATLNLCFNRIVKWFSCICVLGGIMMCMMIIVAYGITMGYQTAQEELARFAVKSRGVDLSFKKVYGSRRSERQDTLYSFQRRSGSLLNLTHLNESTTVSILEFYDKGPPNKTLDDSKETPVFIEFTTSTFSTVSRDTETTPSEELSEPSDRLIERARRSKDNFPKNSNQSFWRPLKKKKTNTTENKPQESDIVIVHI